MENLVIAKKFFNEWIIKETIESNFNFGIFKKTESPDLQNKKMGIEITSANPKMLYFNGNFNDKVKRKEIAESFSRKEHFELVKTSFIKKINKLNSKSANYKNLPAYGIFIETLFDSENITEDEIKTLLNCQIKAKRKYSFLILGDLNNDNLTFIDFKKDVSVTIPWDRDKHKRKIKKLFKDI